MLVISGYETLGLSLLGFLDWVGVGRRGDTLDTFRDGIPETNGGISGIFSRGLQHNFFSS